MALGITRTGALNFLSEIPVGGYNRIDFNPNPTYLESKNKSHFFYKCAALKLYKIIQI